MTALIGTSHLVSVLGGLLGSVGPAPEVAGTPGRAGPDRQMRIDPSLQAAFIGAATAS